MWVGSDWYSWAVWCCAGNLLAPLPVGQRRFNLTLRANCPYLKMLLLYFLWLKVSSFVCGAVLCAGVEGLAGGCEERRACPAPAAASSGRFRPVPAGAVQATAQHLRGSSFKKREKSTRPWGVRKKKVRNSPLSPSCKRGWRIWGREGGGKVCFNLPLSLTILNLF